MKKERAQFEHFVLAKFICMEAIDSSPRSFLPSYIFRIDARLTQLLSELRLDSKKVWRALVARVEQSLREFH